jgi:ATP-dependent Clp protease ATP-binding subunit ClpC
VLAKEGFDAAFGARPLRRAIQRMVEDPLSEEILAGQWVAGDVVELSGEGGALVFRKGSGTPESAPRRPSRPKAERAPRSRPASPRRGGSASGGAAGE